MPPLAGSILQGQEPWRRMRVSYPEPHQLKEEGENDFLDGSGRSTTLRYSLIMPVLNAAERLDQVLTPLLELDSRWQVLLVDDASQDGSREVLKRYPFDCLYQAKRSGQSAARNLAASYAQGDILVFLDSDVVVQTETLQKMALLLEESRELDGVFGCYSSQGNAGEWAVSRFRNLLHRYVHQCSAGPVGSFWAGLGAIRKQSFIDHGAFDSRLDGIEDVELGARISKRGGRFWLEPRFEGRHLKQWTLTSMVHTDIYVRAAPWTYYSLLGVTPRRGLNLSPRFALAPLFLLLLMLTPLLTVPSVLCLLAYLATNLHHYRYFVQTAGWRRGLGSVFFLLIHHLCCLVGAALGGFRYLLHLLKTFKGEL